VASLFRFSKEHRPVRPTAGADRRGANWMTPDRIARLEALPGWSWNLRTDAWETGFSRLLAFVESEGHARVPRKHVDAQSYRLGQWVFEQRRLHRKGKLPDHRVARLAALRGWVWNVRKQESAASTG
jgi:hypothetical protein